VQKKWHNEPRATLENWCQNSSRRSRSNHFRKTTLFTPVTSYFDVIGANVPQSIANTVSQNGIYFVGAPFCRHKIPQKL
jgi:hypothetical protein